LRDIGLTEKNTRRIVEAMLSNIGPLRVQKFLSESQDAANKLGIQGFTMRVTEIDHPKGFPCLAMGLMNP